MSELATFKSCLNRRRRERKWRKGERDGSPQISLYTTLFVTVSQSMFRSSFEVPYEVGTYEARCGWLVVPEQCLCAYHRN